MAMERMLTEVGKTGKPLQSVIRKHGSFCHSSWIHSLTLTLWVYLCCVW